MVSRKVFCGASNPFMTGMASRRGFEARRWRSFSAAGPKGARCRPSRGAPCASLPSPLPLAAAASLLQTLKLSAWLRSASVVLYPTDQLLSPGLGPCLPRGPVPGGAARDIRTALGGSPSGGKRPTRVSRGENSGHAHQESRLRGEAGLERQTRPFQGGHTPRVVPRSSLWLRPDGFPGAPPTLGMVSGSQCRLLELGCFLSTLKSLRSSVTARVKEASFAS